MLSDDAANEGAHGRADLRPSQTKLGMSRSGEDDSTVKMDMIMPTNLPRSRSGTKSHTITSISILMPPLPTPCTLRPPISVAPL